MINETLSKKPFDNPFKYPDEIAFKATSNDAKICSSTYHYPMFVAVVVKYISIAFDGLMFTSYRCFDKFSRSAIRAHANQ